MPRPLGPHPAGRVPPRAGSQGAHAAVCPGDVGCVASEAGAGVLGAGPRWGRSPGSGECSPGPGSGDAGTPPCARGCAAHGAEGPARAAASPGQHGARARDAGATPSPQARAAQPASGFPAAIWRRDSQRQDPAANGTKRKWTPEGRRARGRWVPAQSREGRLHSHHPNPGGPGETGKSLLTEPHQARDRRSVRPRWGHGSQPAASNSSGRHLRISVTPPKRLEATTASVLLSSCSSQARSPPRSH